jgi:hypothetical protein
MRAVADLLDAVGDELRAGGRGITGAVVQVPVAPERTRRRRLREARHPCLNVSR